jgi:hypothetical protein
MREKTMHTRNETGKRAAAIAVLFFLLFGLGSCEQPTGGGLLPTEQGTDVDNGEDDEDYEGVGDSETYEPKIDGIAITSYPNTTYFAKGQPFSSEGLEIRLKYDNGAYGRTLLFSASEYTVENIDTEALAPADPNTTRAKLVRVTSDTAEGKWTVSYGIRIDSSTSILTNIRMVSPPSKTAYTLGEDFTAAGMVVGGTYSGGDRNGEEVTLSMGAVGADGYSKFRRGTQTVTLKQNGTTLGTVTVTVKVPAGAEITLNYPLFVTTRPQSVSLKNIQIKGRAYSAAYANIRPTVKAGGQTFILDAASGSITDSDLSGYDSTPGSKTVTLDLDGVQKKFAVYVADAEPEVWFDYGYRRTQLDPAGKGPGAGVYYARPNETLVLSPVRFLIGYSEDHQNTGVTCTWEYIGTPPSADYTLQANGEFCSFTPRTAGTYRVRVTVSGRDYVTGGTATKSVETDVVCYAAALPKVSGYHLPLKDFAPGQQNDGVGNGWSLGSALGYEVWSLPNGANPLTIHGNPFAGWSEAGIVWVQYDGNGNGIPDESWYELRGFEDDDAHYREFVNRRFAIRYIRAPTPPYYKWNGTMYVYDRAADTEGLETSLDGSHQNRPVYWVDAKGRAGCMDGWPYRANLPDEGGTYAVYSGTILRDNGGDVGSGYTDKLPFVSYVDSGGNDKYPYATFNVARDAIRADGSPAGLDPAQVRFVKVQTAVFAYGGVFGNVSTEITHGTNLPDQSGGFPMPEGGFE